jgi:CRP-like cAMP-binding protein
MLTVIEKVLLLQDMECFRYAYTEHLAELASLCTEKTYEHGSVLFAEGQPSTLLHLLVEGFVKLEAGGKEVATVEKCGLDHFSSFARCSHLYTARAVENCTVLMVQVEEMVDVLTSEPEFCWAIARYMAQLGRDLESEKLPAP